MADGEAPAKKSDLGVRTASAVVMLVVAGGALWLGGWWFDTLVLLVALACFAELGRLVVSGFSTPTARMAGLLAGLSYIGLAGWFLIWSGPDFLVEIVLGVIATDIGAYFAGRSIGGPKIAPRISPSKTWAGLIGGMLLAGCVLAVEAWATSQSYPQLSPDMLFAALFGALIAVVAQAGDFLESWLKRRAGVKDSSRLIPGHGGVFDRVDGLVAVSFVLGFMVMAGIAQ